MFSSFGKSALQTGKNVESCLKVAHPNGCHAWRVTGSPVARQTPCKRSEALSGNSATRPAGIFPRRVIGPSST